MTKLGLPLLGGVLVGYAIALLFPTLQTIIPYVKDLDPMLFSIGMGILGVVLIQLK